MFNAPVAAFEYFAHIFKADLGNLGGWNGGNRITVILNCNGLQIDIGNKTTRPKSRNGYLIPFLD